MMKKTILIALALALPAFVIAQETKDARPARPQGLGAFSIFDTNKDGVLDAAEIANASKALQSIANSEGKVTSDEVRAAMSKARGGKGPREGAKGRQGGGFRKQKQD